MNAVLAQMGIPVWRLRDASTNLPTAPPFKLVCVAEHAYADKALLSNILKALQCPEDQVNIIWVNEPSELALQLWDKLPTVVFGEALIPYAPDSSIQTVRLTDLSANIPAKKALWAALKNL
jgi:DNA polymerase III psi subunit